MFKYIAAAFLSLSMLAGCSSLGQGDSLLAEVAVRYATMKYLEEHPEKADRVVELAEQAKVLLDTDLVSLVDIKQEIMKRVDFHEVGAADYVLISTLADLIATEVRVNLDGGYLTDDQKVKVNQILDYIIVAVSITPRV